MAAASTEHLDARERKALGRAARAQAPRSAGAGWEPSPGRPDPIDVLQAQAVTREPDLVPIRYGRMVASPFAFFRGGPAIMAADLAATPVSGIDVQLCGDAHLANFGLFGSPERALMFGLNDFDETLPGPWEWDVKRLAASVAVAARQNGFPLDRQLAAARETVRAYREAMRTFAAMPTLDLWHLHLSAHEMVEFARRLEAEFGVATADLTAGQLRRSFARARARDNLAALSKLCVRDGETLTLASRPPLLTPARELWRAADAAVVFDAVRLAFDRYRDSLSDERRALLDQFEIVDLARKVVGVGSVGTRCFVLLLRGKSPQDVLFLQIKQAERGVLEPYLRPSGYANHGQRVVAGQRLLQTVPDILLGWTSVPDGREYYVRQLWDMKGGIDPSKLTPGGLGVYGGLCGWTLARAHGRGGDEAAIAGYLGGGPAFDEAVADFAVAYAEVNEQDHRDLVAAVDRGLVHAA